VSEDSALFDKFPLYWKVRKKIFCCC